MSEALIIAILSSSLLSTIISNLFNMWKERAKKKKEKETEKEKRTKIDRLLVLSALKNQARGMIELSYRTELSTKELREYYDCYKKDLGGDGFADIIYNEAMTLPLKV